MLQSSRRGGGSRRTESECGCFSKAWLQQESYSHRGSEVGRGSCFKTNEPVSGWGESSVDKEKLKIQEKDEPADRGGKEHEVLGRKRGRDITG